MIEQPKRHRSDMYREARLSSTSCKSTSSVNEAGVAGGAQEFIEHCLFGEDWCITSRRLERDRRLFKMSQLIRLHYADVGLTLTSAARRCGTSKNHLNVLLLREVPHTFHDLLTRYRIMRSAEMLEYSDWNVLEIALANGFGSVSSYARNFKKLFGWPPRALRRALLRQARRRAVPRQVGQTFTPLVTNPAMAESRSRA